MSGPWEKYQNQAAAGPWTKYAQPTADAQMAPPPVPAAPIPAGLQGPPASTGAAPKVGNFADTLGAVGSSLKNAVTGTAAMFAPPQTTGEKAMSLFGPQVLPAYRGIVKPSIDAGKTAITQAKKGNLYNNEDYDAQGNYRPSAFSSAVDAIPVAGPWTRKVENDAQQKGMVPALAGMATDVLGPMAAAKVGGLAAQGVGKAAQLASTDLPSAKLYGTRLMVPGTSGELLQSALKPGVKYGAGVGGNLETALPDVLKADPSLKGVSGFAKASDAAANAAFQPYNDLISPYRPPAGGTGPVRPGTIPGQPIADAQNASIPAIDRFESPKFSAPGTNPSSSGGAITRTADKASLYKQDISVPTADAIRQDANAKLNAFYAKTGGDQNAALSNAETARIKAIGDTTRQGLYSKLEQDNSLQSGTVAGMQEKYGNLADTASIANKREPVFARHDPVSLSQKIVAGHGGPVSAVWNYMVQKGMSGLTNSDALVNSAVDRFQNPGGTPLPARQGLFPAMGSALGNGLYGAGKAARSAPLSLNPLFYSSFNPPKR